MKHDWYSASGGGILSALWLADQMKVALMKPTFVPDRDVQKVFADIAAQELAAGAGYTAGGAVLANKATNYDAAADRTNLVADDVTWGPGATFDTGFAVVYDNTSATKILWSVVNFEGTKSVVNGVFTLDWAAVGLLYIVPVP